MTALSDKPRPHTGGQTPSLSQRFPWLRSVVVDLEFFDAAGVNLLSFMQYKPNLAQATSIFPFGGYSADERLSELEATRQVWDAIQARRTVVSGEWPRPRLLSNAEDFQKDPLNAINILRFRLTLDYAELQSR